MSYALLVLLVFNLFCIWILPKVFFRRDGTFNLKWWLTASPYVLALLFLVYAYREGLAPLWFYDESTLNIITAVSVCLSSFSVLLMGMTIGTNRVPLSLWHQENDAPKNIVTYGAYKHIRHPFYTSFLICLLSCVIAFPHLVTVGCLIYAFVILNITAAREERRLSASQFGEEYKAYKAKTGRFFPGC